jgi:hypothetical protein
MVLRTDSRDADLSMLAYLVVLATVATVLAYSLYWLRQPYAVPNPGLAAYKAPTGLFMSRATPLDPNAGTGGGLVAELAAAEARAEASASAPERAVTPPKPRRTTQSNVRTAVQRGRDVWARDGWGQSSWGQSSWGQNSWGQDSWGRDTWNRDARGRDSSARDVRSRNAWVRDQWGNSWQQRPRGYRDNPYAALGRR